MLEYYDAVLHAVREGLLLLDGDRCVQLVNDEARRLLGLEGDVTGRHVTELGLSPELASTLSQQRLAVDEVHVSGDRVLVVSQMPATPKGRSVGAVVTLRDHTDLQALTGELDSVRAFASRCAPRRTRRPTGCTPRCRWWSWAAPRRPWSSPPPSSRSPSGSPTGWWRRSRTGAGRAAAGQGGHRARERG